MTERSQVQVCWEHPILLPSLNNTADNISGNEERLHAEVTSHFCALIHLMVDVMCDYCMSHGMKIIYERQHFHIASGQK